VNLLEKQLSTVYFKDVRFPWVTLYLEQACSAVSCRSAGVTALTDGHHCIWQLLLFKSRRSAGVTYKASSCN